jgi:hypothetical protein
LFDVSLRWPPGGLSAARLPGASEVLTVGKLVKAIVTSLKAVGKLVKAVVTSLKVVERSRYAAGMGD